MHNDSLPSYRHAGLDPASNNQTDRSRVKHGMTILSPRERVRERVRKFGFTLAEVLITLGIIGVVAVLVMPAMVENYQKRQAVVGLKKAYSVMTNAFNYAESQYGPISTWPEVQKDSNTANFDSDKEALPFGEKYLLPALKYHDFKRRPLSVFRTGNYINALSGVSNVVAGA